MERKRRFRKPPLKKRKAVFDFNENSRTEKE
jgi:hypothetical protein